MCHWSQRLAATVSGWRRMMMPLPDDYVAAFERLAIVFMAYRLKTRTQCWWEELQRRSTPQAVSPPATSTWLRRGMTVLRKPAGTGLSPRTQAGISLDWILSSKPSGIRLPAGLFVGRTDRRRLVGAETVTSDNLAISQQLIERRWCRRGGSNSGPTDYESVALPLSYVGIPAHIAAPPRRGK